MTFQSDKPPIKNSPCLGLFTNCGEEGIRSRSLSFSLSLRSAKSKRPDPASAAHKCASPPAFESLPNLNINKKDPTQVGSFLLAGYLGLEPLFRQAQQGFSVIF